MPERDIRRRAAVGDGVAPFRTSADESLRGSNGRRCPARRWQAPVPTSYIAPAAAFAPAGAAERAPGDDRGEAVLRDHPREGCLRSGDAVGHLAAELLGSFDAGGKVDTREGFTDVERGAVAVVVPPARTASTRSSAVAAAKFLDFMMSTPVQKETLGTFSTQSVNKEVKPTETDELRSFRLGYARCRRAAPALRSG
jgi:hypothetical protein